MNTKDTLYNDIAPDIHQEQYGDDGKLIVWQERPDGDSELEMASYILGDPVEVKR